MLLFFHREQSTAMLQRFLLLLVVICCIVFDIAAKSDASAFGRGQNFHQAIHHTNVASKAADHILSQQQASRSTQKSRRHQPTKAQIKKKIEQEQRKKKILEEFQSSDGECSTDDLPLTWDIDDDDEDNDIFEIPTSMHDDIGGNYNPEESCAGAKSSSSTPLLPKKLKTNIKTNDTPKRRRPKKRKTRKNQSCDHPEQDS